jgi:glycosyltransferase involved in cell wall biosynthesis
MDLATVWPEERDKKKVMNNRVRSLEERPRIAVMIPCYNEELTVRQVIESMRSTLPYAEIYVYDNNSKDRTSEIAAAAGAIVRFEKRQGKGFVLQRMFREIDADIYLMIDGDSTYPPSEAQRLIDPIVNDGVDMVIGSRLMKASNSEFRRLKRFGNKFFLRTINSIFKVEITDILSGYRAFSRKFVKNVLLFAGGFDTETEMTIKALALGYQVIEVPVDLIDRPDGSSSKIRIVSDGSLILKMIFVLFRDYKPLTFFGGIGLVMISVGLVLGGVVVYEFIETGLVLRFPTAILATGMELAGMLSITVGLILHTIARRSREIEHQIQTLYEEIERDRDQP